MTENEQKLKGYLDSVYIMSHSYSTIAAYRIAIVNQNKTGFRDYLQEQYNIDELEFVDKVKQEKFDVYAMLRDHVVFLDKNNYMVSKHCIDVKLFLFSNSMNSTPDIYLFKFLKSKKAHEE